MKYIENYIYDEDYIGKGTFSKVYIGYEKNAHKKKYAIKKIYRKSNKKYVKYLNLEIEIMNKLNHKNIIKLYHTIYTEKHVFLILELCDTDLYTYIHNNIITEKNTQYIVKQIIDAIKYIMDNNIVHRDLKPHNILINEETKEIKLCDFGFAREFKDTLLTDTICGSPLYMAPELLQNQKYNIKSDIWSLGIIMYEIVMKNHPFKSNNISDLINKINNNKPILTNSDFSNGCKELISDLLIVDYTKRLDWDDIFTNKWIYTPLNENNNINYKNNINVENFIKNDDDGEMYFDDIYNSIIEDIEDLENPHIEEDLIDNDIDNDDIDTKIEITINTQMSTPINIINNIENEYIFVNKPNNKSVLNKLMDNSNEIMKKIKKMI